jgi:hypothetical protein
MSEITDEFMTQMLSRARDYSIVILKAVPNRSRPGAEKIIREHARRNFLLRARGLLPIVCPITDGGDLAGIGIFNADVDLVKSIMDEDPAVKEGILVYEAHPFRTFPVTACRLRRSEMIKAARGSRSIQILWLTQGRSDSRPDRSRCKKG